MKYKKSILLSAWSDPHTMGIFCQKTNLIEYALDNLRSLRREGEKRRLFAKGVAEADEHSFKDLAYEISNVRNLTKHRFDSLVLSKAGFSAYSEMKEAIADCHDWENEEMKRVGHEIEQGMIERFKRTNERMAAEAMA